MKKNIVVLMTSHNRKHLTLRCLEIICSIDGGNAFHLEVVLVDDGSTDGTGLEVSARFPNVSLERGDGTLFWNRGMDRAFQAGVRSDPDFVLWLNDDTNLAPGAVQALLSTHEMLKEEFGECVVVGATVDNVSGETTYGGMIALSRLRRFNFRKLAISAEPEECDAMNGNIVLIPRAIYKGTGSLDPIYEHALGDIDYALRVRKAGFRVFVAPGAQGYCAANSLVGTHRDAALPLRERWVQFKGRKVLPAPSWRHFVRQHAGWSWPIYFTWPYVNFAIHLVSDAVRLRRSRA